MGRLNNESYFCFDAPYFARVNRCPLTPITRFPVCLADSHHSVVTITLPSSASRLALLAWGIWRYNVDAATFNRLATVATVILESFSIAFATWRSLAESEGGLPPTRPRSRAALNPAVVRSRITPRSNSANAAKIWKTSLPLGELVSMGPVWISTLYPRPGTIQLFQ